MSAYRHALVPVAVARASARQKYDGTQRERVLEMAAEGKFPEEWCAELGINSETLYAWANRYPEFEEAVVDAWHLLHAWWARFLRDNLTRAHFKAPTAFKLMARRFPSTWGSSDPRNTLEHFLQRPRELAGAGEAASAPLAHLSDDEVAQRIATLSARRRHDADAR